MKFQISDYFEIDEELMLDVTIDPMHINTFRQLQTEDKLKKEDRKMVGLLILSNYLYEILLHQRN